MIEYHVGAPRYPVLEAYWECREPVSFIIGPLGSGKTYASVQRMLRQMLEQQPNAQGERLTRWICIRNTYRDLTSTTIRDFGAVFGEIAKVTMGGPGPPVWRGAFALRDGTCVRAEVEFIALELEQDVRRLRGVQCTGVWLNEARELERSAVEMADLRHGRYPSLADGGVMPTWSGMFGDTNAFDTEHWLYHAMQSKPRGWRFFVQPGGVKREGERWVANPEAENLANLRPDYYVQGVEGKREDWIRCNLANEFIFAIDGKAVHPEFAESMHVAREELLPVQGLPLVLGFDFGRTPAMVVTQQLRSGAWNVLDEFYLDDASAATFGPLVYRLLRQRFPQWVPVADSQMQRQHVIWPLLGWGDPAGNAKGQATDDTPLQMLRASGVPCEAAPTNDAALRRAALTGPLTRMVGGRPGILLSPRCSRLRRGLAGGFQYRRLKVAGSERFTDLPDKNEFSHVCEALEYALLGEGEGLSTLSIPAPYRIPDERLPDTAIL